MADSIRLIFAVGRAEERAAFAALAEGNPYFATVHYPEAISAVEALFSADAADAIVTDFSFHSGAFADWLTLWPLPALLLTDPGDDPERIGRSIRDEAALYLERDPEGRYLSKIPLLLRKVLNIRESLSRQNAHLQMTEHQYLNLLQAVPDIVYILDGDGRFIYLNDSVRSLGYEPAKLIGRHFSEIIHPSELSKVSRLEALRAYKGVITGPDKAPKLFDERRAGSRMTRNLELRLRHNASAENFLNASVNSYGEVNCSGFHLPEYEGKRLGTIGIIRDVTERRCHELELEEALASRDVLLKEVHHRVKNNLQVVSSLLSLQGAAVDDETARGVFVECQTQIQSMAMVHEVLYRGQSFEGVDMQEYFRSLLDYLSGVYEGRFRGIRHRVEAHSVVLDLDAAMAIALIVNELASNAFKHAFPEGRVGEILVRMGAEEAQWLLEVSDDGVGCQGSGPRAEPSPAGAPAGALADESEPPGIGTELVSALVAQLRGELEMDGGSGTRARIRFPAEAG